MHKRSPWWIFLILLLCRIAECNDEKIKRAIYNYQKGPKESSGGKSNEEFFKSFQGVSPFEQVLAALGLSGDDQSKIHTSVEYWPPDMDREKFYQMVKGEAFPFTSWGNEQQYSNSASTPSPIYKPIYETIQNDEETPPKISIPIKKPENSYKYRETENLSQNYNPQFIDHVVSYPSVEHHKEKSYKDVTKAPKYIENVPQVFEEVFDYPEYPSYIEETSKSYEKLPEIVKEIPKIRTPKIKEVFHKSQEINNDYPEYPSYIEETSKSYEKLPEIVKEIPKVRTPKIKEVFHKQQEAPKFHYILQTPKAPKIRDEVIKKAPLPPRVVEVTPKIIMEAFTTSTSTTFKPKLSKAKYFIHTSKLPEPDQPELPSSSIVKSKIENSSHNDDISMTDAGPVLFPEVTTLRNNVQRGSVKNIPQPANHREHMHEVRVHEEEKSQQQQPRSSKKRKLKKKVKTSSIAQEVVDIGNRGSSGKLNAPLPPQPFDVIVVTSTIAPKTSFIASTTVNYIANNADVTTSNLSDGYAGPNYSDMIDNLSKLTELTFNTKSYKTESINSYVPKIISTTEYVMPVTETFNNHSFEFSDNSSLIADENMIAVLNLMRNTSTTMSSSSMEELKKAVIDNDLPKVKKIVRHHVGKRPIKNDDKGGESSSTTEKSKSIRSRFGIREKITVTSTESSTSLSTKSLSSSKVRAKIIKKPVTTTVKQVISTTARSSRQSIRTRPQTTSRSTKKPIARRITTTRKSIKTTTDA